MKLKDFVIGKTFWMSGKQYRTTDIGTRTVIAICIQKHYCPKNFYTLVKRCKDRDSFLPIRLINSRREEAVLEQKTGWFNGPPYAVPEYVVDENDFNACYKRPPDWYFRQWCTRGH